MHDLQPIMSDRKLFTDALYISVTAVFMTVDPAKMLPEQEVELTPHV